MGVRIKSLPFVGIASVLGGTKVVDSTIEQREVTVDGMSYHFGPNEVKNFLDEGVGAKVGAFRDDGIVEDEIPFGSSRT